MSVSGDWIKLVMCGDSGVGKTNIMARYTRNTFMEDSMSTIGAEFATRTVPYESKLGTKQMKLQIWDTAGQERYRAITRSYYRDAVGCVLVYSVISKRSFTQLEKWIDEIRQNSNRDPVIVVLGNKCDEEPSKRKVTLAMVEEIVKKHNLAFCLETSAKTGENVEKAFRQLIERLVEKNPALADPAPPPSSEQKGVVVDAKSQGSRKKCC